MSKKKDDSKKQKTWSHKLGCWVNKGTDVPLPIEVVSSVEKRREWLSLTDDAQSRILANKYFWIISRPQTQPSISKEGNASQAVVKGTINKKLHYFSYLLKEMSKIGAKREEVDELWRSLKDRLVKVMGDKYVELGERPPQVVRNYIGRSNRFESLEKQFELWKEDKLFPDPKKKKK